MKLKTLAGMLLGLGLIGQAHAATISGNALQGVLDGVTQGGSSSIDVQTDQVVNDDTWALSASGGSVSTLIVEIAAYADSNSFGLYDSSNPANYVEIMPGSDSSGAQALVSIKADGSVHVNNADSGVDFAGNMFGYYLNVAATGNRYFSDTALNADGTDHMAAFQGNDSDVVQLPGYLPGTWSSNEYILAFEDLWQGGDQDFTDFVAMVESVVPVPAPGSLALLGLGLGLLGVGGLRQGRRR